MATYFLMIGYDSHVVWLIRFNKNKSVIIKYEKNIGIILMISF